jgi:hypothetical protein
MKIHVQSTVSIRQYYFEMNINQSYVYIKLYPIKIMDDREQFNF